MISSDTIIFGILAGILGVLFFLRERGGVWDRVFTFVPIILLAYLVPSLLVSFGVIDASESSLWTIAKDYFLTAALILLTLSIDIKGIIGLGPKALIMFFTATIGIVIGGPIALWTVAQFAPEILAGEGADAAWRGFATLAGSWIGGGANQTAMLEVYGYNMEQYGAMVAVDIVVANIWMAFLLYGAGMHERVDRWLRADNSSVERLRDSMAAYSEKVAKVASANEMIVLAGFTFAAVAFSHWSAGWLSLWFTNMLGEEAVLADRFFWVVVMATTIGLASSFTPARSLEGVGASKIGTVFIFLLVAVIGTKMDIFQLGDAPLFMAVGLIWMIFHSALLLIVARIVRAPFFFVAVGSKANVGGAASAPVVAGAFHPALAPVGVLLAVLGYALGTYGAILCAEMMRAVSGG